MIQIYNPTNTTYTANGDAVLMPIECTLSQEINGAWTLNLTHPVDDEGRWKLITEGAVVKAPAPNGDQLFRLTTVTKTDAQITAAGQPIFMDAAGDCFLVDIRPTNANGQQALEAMLAPNNKYSASSNITKTATAYYQFKNFIEALNGGDDNSFISRWGGEVYYNNFEVIVNTRVGEDNGLEIRYGKNIPVDGFSQNVDISSVVTRIYPKSYNGYTMTNNGYVDSPLIDNYPTIHAVTMTFDDVKMTADATDDDEENGVIICDTQAELDAALTQRCNEQYAAGVDAPVVTIDCDMVQLENTEAYADVKGLVSAGLGDDVRCINNHLGITTTARVVALEWDCVLKRVNHVTIGEPAYNYFNSVTSSMNRVEQAIRPNGTVVGEQIAGFINGAMAQLRVQKSVAQKQDVRAVFFEDTDPDSPTFGAMAIGTQGLQISRQRNEDGTDWIWTTALTSEGLIASIIVAGVISSQTGGSYWNLNNGEFASETTSGFTGDIKIKDGHITSEGTLLGFYRKIDIYNGGITFTWEQDGDSGTVQINGTQIIKQSSQNDGYISLQHNDGGWYVRAYGADVNNNAALGPGNIEINNMSVMAVQSGKFSARIPAEGWVEQPITFPQSFNSPPIVIPIFESTSSAGEFGECNIAVNSITNIGAKIKMFNAGTAGRTPNVFWVALGR